ncbi:FecCD family ABC transporter permease [Carnobacterium gallinarum]|uniref:FecCD family ABC transporter permease n=1 Tax=Carnobacterium gallinarum TaxID=2749 RepID=UPI0005532474|nr:iron ABC transporter permease [Carnobacterium gallinarum]
MSNRFKQKTYWLTIGLLLIFIGLCFLISMNTGLMTLSPNEIFQTLIGNGTSQQELILYDFRLPRISLAILVGAGLAISGCILQGVTRNPLADTGILGINAGAGIAVLLFVTYFSSASGSSVFLLPIIAFIGAAVATLLIYLLSYKKGEGITTTRFVLTGVAVAAGITALMIVFTLRLSPTKYQFITTWLAGSIWGSSWVFVWVLLLWLVILVPLAFRKAKVLDLFSLGEEATIGLGVNLEKERVILLSIAVAIAGVSVSVSGGIGFIGLLAPHLARQLVGSRHRYLLPLSALIGSSLLIVADTLGRVVISPAEMPAGILVSIIGAPYFLYILSRGEN